MDYMKNLKEGQSYIMNKRDGTPADSAASAHTIETVDQSTDENGNRVTTNTLFRKPRTIDAVPFPYDPPRAAPSAS
jgi:hypothetical protein